MPDVGPKRKANAELRIRNVAKVCGSPQRPSAVPRPFPGPLFQ